MTNAVLPLARRRSAYARRRGRSGLTFVTPFMIVFTLFMVAACGVVGKSFFPDATGALTQSGLAGATDRATAVLAPHADNLLFIKNIKYRSLARFATFPS